MSSRISRRLALGRIANSSLVLGAAASLTPPLLAGDAPATVPLKGRIHHSVCRWCYKQIPLDELCRASKSMGLQAMDLVEVNDFPTLKQHGLICAMVTGVPGMITSGLNRVSNHDAIYAWMEQTIPAAANAGAPNIICFSGNRAGMSDEEGLDHCTAGLKRIMPVAERHRITICLELLNSKRTHKDYMGDHTAWGVELVHRVGSERFKLLFDIFHMQIMEGDLIATIRENYGCFAHYHTGGVPGRGEIDESQEIQYPSVMRAILETGFQGFVAQEFVPKRPDALSSLRQGVQICDV
jgi:hydroxypyruvate isomerase